MITWLKLAIAWVVAREDLEELDRWRVEANQVRRWMAEFPDVCTALDHLECFAYGRPYRGLTEVREGMRKRRDSSQKFSAFLHVPRMLTRSELDDLERTFRNAIGAVPPALIGSVVDIAPATDWDVALRS